jgi:hypothetical protein
MAMILADDDMILAIFGCAKCGGDHRNVGASVLECPVQIDGVAYQRAFVCPVDPHVVFVSDEHDETRER